MSQAEDVPTKKLQAAIVAIQFLSSIPVGRQPMPTEQCIGESLSWYPIVGILLGAILYSLSLVITALFPSFLAAALILTLWVMLTGALHLDGFADSADAWMGGLGSKERTLRLLKDPTSGPIAIAAMILLLMLKLFAIESLIQHQALFLLLWPLIVGRISVALLFVTTPYARKSGLGSAISEHKKDQYVWIVSCTIALISCAFITWMIVPLLVTTVIGFWYLRSRMMKRLKGCTGDTAGALLEIIECTSLLSLAACVTA